MRESEFDELCGLRQIAFQERYYLLWQDRASDFVPVSIYFIRKSCITGRVRINMGMECKAASNMVIPSAADWIKLFRF